MEEQWCKHIPSSFSYKIKTYPNNYFPGNLYLDVRLFLKLFTVPLVLLKFDVSPTLFYQKIIEFSKKKKTVSENSYSMVRTRNLGIDFTINKNYVI